MIVQDLEQTIFLDTGRPDIFDDSDREKWSKLHKWIKETDHKILVNGAFFVVDKILLEENGRYGGGGFQYKFWFENEEGKEAFGNKIFEIFNNYPFPMKLVKMEALKFCLNYIKQINETEFGNLKFDPNIEKSLKDSELEVIKFSGLSNVDLIKYLGLVD